MQKTPQGEKKKSVAKPRTSVYFKDEANRDKLKELAAHFKWSESQVFEEAVKELHEKVIGKKPAKPKR